MPAPMPPMRGTPQWPKMKSQFRKPSMGSPSRKSFMEMDVPPTVSVRLRSTITGVSKKTAAAMARR